MNYKKIIKSQKARFFVLKMFGWVPDKAMIKIQYRIKTGRKLNLKDPKRFTEKLQWYKLYYHNPVMHQCVDKYEVRKYVEQKGLKKILNDLYGVYNSPDEIAFDKLPDKFVIKTTTGGGGQNVIICKDKKKLNVKKTKKDLSSWLKNGVGKSFGREWAYEGVKNRIIAEKYIESKDDSLVDYKFFCFNGEVKYIYVISDRKLGKTARLGIYDSDFKKLDAYRADEQKQTTPCKKPVNFDLMKEYASVLSRDFPHARIDLYDNNNCIIFGEITFYDGSGYMRFDPDEFDNTLGKEFLLVRK